MNSHRRKRAKSGSVTSANFGDLGVCVFGSEQCHAIVACLFVGQLTVMPNDEPETFFALPLRLARLLHRRDRSVGQPLGDGVRRTVFRLPRALKADADDGDTDLIGQMQVGSER